jgi:hypothetical protein
MSNNKLYIEELERIKQSKLQQLSNFKRLKELQKAKIEQEALEKAKLVEEALEKAKIEQEELEKSKLEYKNDHVEDGVMEEDDNEENENEEEEEEEDNVHNFKTIYIVSKIQGGGSKKYLDDLTNHYENTTFIYVTNRLQLLNTTYLPCDILFVQHLLFTNIFPKDLNIIRQKYKLKIIISVHDFYWFIPNIPDISSLLHILPSTNPHCENAYLNPPDDIHPSIVTLFNNASMVIHPSSFTKKHFDKFFKTDNTVVQPHNDIKVDYKVKKIPPIIKKQINIGHFVNFTEYKGSEFTTMLKNKYKNYKNYNINFLILEQNILPYTELNWPEKIIQHNFHCLLHLNKYGETYSYALTKSINSGLPILYNNIGSYPERIPTNTHYIQVYHSEYEMNDDTILYSQFEKMLDYIIENNGVYKTSNSNTNIEYHELYNYIFDDRLEPSINTMLHEKIKPFAVYFPQFHSVPENNQNYYTGMTDIVQLNFYIQRYMKDNEIIDTPSLSELNINNILEYKLTNKKIINKQIEIAKKFSIYGFACYYYWFSENTITNKHTIFEQCYNLFFDEVNNFKIYFLWANENWTNNPAFNVKTEKITNTYNFSNFMTNINNLITYFKHPNYHKVNNKPLFAIHHSWYMSEEQLCLFDYMLNSECCKHGFDGATLIVNNMVYKYSTYKTYNFSPSYKGGEPKDYQEYINTIIKAQLNNNSSIHTIFFDFNNSARFAVPYRTDCVSKFVNTTIYNQDYLINLILQEYKTSDDQENNILLINSWNEWGENMAIEPGEINKTKFLSLIKSNLLSFLSK